MFLIAASVLLIGVLAFVFMIRSKDLPEVAPATPWGHLEARRAQIYENLRDLQFEYRVGKLSDADYQSTKNELQGELAGVLAEIDRLKVGQALPPGRNGAKAHAAKPANACPHCAAKFDRALKFCGECGKPMGVNA